MCLNDPAAALDDIDVWATPPTRNILSKLRILVSRGEFAVGEGEGGVAGAGVNNVKLFQGSTCRSDLTSVWSASPSLACDWLNL